MPQCFSSKASFRMALISSTSLKTCLVTSLATPSTDFQNILWILVLQYAWPRKELLMLSCPVTPCPRRYPRGLSCEFLLL